MSRLSKISIGLWLWLALGVYTNQAAADLALGGYIKQFSLALAPPALGSTVPPWEGTASHRLRLEIDWDHALWRAELAYDWTPRIQPAGAQANGFFLPRPAPLTYRVVDLDTHLYPANGSPQGTFSLGHNLDRALLIFSPAWGDIYLGRQAVAFGAARTINPTDVIAPFAYASLDKEERIGVDALRARLPLGDLSELDGGIILGDGLALDQSAAFLRLRLYGWQTDWVPTLVLFKENLLVGFDLARPLGGAGWWLESAYTWSNVLKKEAPDDTYLRLSTGFDYSFTPRLYGALEYHFSGAGAAAPEAYPSRLRHPAYTAGAAYLLGRHYLAPALVFQATPLLSFSGQLLLNTADSSLLLAPRLDYSFAQDVFLEAGAFWGRGQAHRLDPVGLTLQTGSEFGLYPDSLFAAVRLYF
ncbi:MAG: hypothetical protein GKR89_15735 [Candidatus Latescibacteria bacterium]|nr:hypothetical protein [Candidatus Latescibacterota bacterium]